MERSKTYKQLMVTIKNDTILKYQDSKKSLDNTPLKESNSTRSKKHIESSRLISATQRLIKLSDKKDKKTTLTKKSQIKDTFGKLSQSIYQRINNHSKLVNKKSSPKKLKLCKESSESWILAKEHDEINRDIRILKSSWSIADLNKTYNLSKDNIKSRSNRKSSPQYARIHDEFKQSSSNNCEIKDNIPTRKPINCAKYREFNTKYNNLDRLKEYKERNRQNLGYDESSKMTPFVRISLADEKEIIIDNEDLQKERNLSNPLLFTQPRDYIIQQEKLFRNDNHSTDENFNESDNFD